VQSPLTRQGMVAGIAIHNKLLASPLSRRSMHATAILDGFPAMSTSPNQEHACFTALRSTQLAPGGGRPCPLHFRDLCIYTYSYYSLQATWFGMVIGTVHTHKCVLTDRRQQHKQKGEKKNLAYVCICMCYIQPALFLQALCMLIKLIIC
jgi:hypothetical protein